MRAAVYHRCKSPVGLAEKQYRITEEPAAEECFADLMPPCGHVPGVAEEGLLIGHSKIL
jgi:hypothetical protein